MFRPRAANQHWCLFCKAEAMREARSRPEYALSEDERRKNRCRAYANVYRRRGKLVQQPCEICGDPETYMHHEDFSKPLEVSWRCMKHRGRWKRG